MYSREFSRKVEKGAPCLTTVGKVLEGIVTCDLRVIRVSHPLTSALLDPQIGYSSVTVQFFSCEPGGILKFKPLMSHTIKQHCTFLQ